jgi:stress responsive alpha/beta barrel protein
MVAFAASRLNADGYPLTETPPNRARPDHFPQVFRAGTDQETTMQRLLPLIILITLLLPLGGCQIRTPHSTITHVVIVNLADPTQTQAVIEDCDTLIADIDSINAYACGTHLETGRSVVLDDYDLALVVGFDSQADYDAYLASDQHTEFLSRWSDRIEKIRIFDFQDPE